ncbi:MAG: alanine racemase [Desulfovibrio sp.]|jgi:alanine racemase|nr:alanine racemase [Desulfovibrio sp.]
MSECTFTPSRCHIDLTALQRNFARLGKSATLMPVIKSDAYGHGLLPVARALADVGARRFAVGTVSEGAALREAGLTQEIVPLLSGMNAEDWHRATAHSLIPLLADREDLEKADFCCRPDKTLRVALKCETGMARLGFTAEDIPAVLEFLRARPYLAPTLVLSHLACADRPRDLAYTHAQTERFTAVCDSLRVAFPDMERSLANSAGLLGLPETRFEVSRPGIALYGGNPFAGTVLENCGVGLEWVMSVSAPVLCVQRVKAGQSVSYGRIFTTPADMTIAVIAAGYATGLDRGLSNSMDVLIGGRRIPQVGHICMGLLMADVSSLPEVRRGDEAWLIGGPVAPGQRAVTAREMADELDTISYEILCRMGAMNPRTYG